MNEGFSKPPAPVGAAPLVCTRGLGKAFSGVSVLHDISLDLRAGEITGIIGENGAGKSTFMKILAGIHDPSAGELSVQGQAVREHSPQAAKKSGIAMVPQELNLVDTLAIFENVFLGNELRRGPLLDKPRMREEVRRIFGRMHVGLDPDRIVGDLTSSQKQMVELAKALSHQAKLLILDEPTSVLSTGEADILFGLLRELAGQGVGVLFISHHLAEVKNLTTRVLVFRDGACVHDGPTAELSERELANRMVGRNIDEFYMPKRQALPQSALSVKGLRGDGLPGPVDFELAKGEILGITGLVGSGRTELAETLVGLRRKTAGDVRIAGEACAIDGYADALARGIAYVTEDRGGKGLLLDSGLPVNIALRGLGGLLRRLPKAAERSLAEQYQRKFFIKTASLDTEMRYLSGGNQQKALFAKWVDVSPRVLILDEPTRGIDVNAKKELYVFMHALAEQGVSIIMISSSFEEIIWLCSRVYVMQGGRIRGELRGADITEQNIIYHAAGVPAAETTRSQE